MVFEKILLGHEVNSPITEKLSITDRLKLIHEAIFNGDVVGLVYRKMKIEV